jgi:hypothetical protein
MFVSTDVKPPIEMLMCDREKCGFSVALRTLQKRMDILHAQTKELQSYLALGKSGRRIKDRFLMGEISEGKFDSLMRVLSNAKDCYGLTTKEKSVVSDLKQQCRLWLDGHMNTDDYVDHVDRIIDGYKGE